MAKTLSYDEEQLALIRQAIEEMPAIEQEKIRNVHIALKQLVTGTDPAALMALALLGAELAAEVAEE